MVKALVLVVSGVVLAGCMPRRVMVMPTPEGQECKRQCMLVEAQCLSGRQNSARECRQRENECLVTCPGADIPR